MLLIFLHSKTSWQRGTMVEHTLIALLTVSAAFQFLIISTKVVLPSQNTRS